MTCKKNGQKTLCERAIRETDAFFCFYVYVKLYNLLFCSVQIESERIQKSFNTIRSKEGKVATGYDAA